MSQLEVYPLFSGSSGNSTYILADGIGILVDAGKNCKHICKALDQIGVDPDSIEGLFVTHSHSDHISGLDVFVRNHPTTVYATEATHLKIDKYSRKPHSDIRNVVIKEYDEVVLSDTVRVLACPTPHDARGSVCYKIIAGEKSFLLLTDVGHLTPEITDFSKGVDGAIVESNYDINMLTYGRYPDELKARVAGNGGHINNEECAELIDIMIDSGTTRFILGHLSEENNTHTRAVETITDYLVRSGRKRNRDYFLTVAERHEPTDGLVL